MMVSSGLAARRDLARTFSGLTGGIAAVAAGLCWVVKAVATLATGDQPALLFELAPLLMAVAVLVLGLQLPPGKLRIICVGMSATALVLGGLVLVDTVVEFPEVASAIFFAGVSLLIVGCLITSGLSTRRRLGPRLPLVLGLATVPAILLGGLAAALWGERALELALVPLGVAWMALGVELARGRYTE